jgi:arylsulfatase A-like enzyme
MQKILTFGFAMRAPVVIVLALIIGPSFIGQSPSAHIRPASAKPPNIIFILTDDLGYGDLGCYGQKMIQTPNLDRMAAEGVRFTDCYSGQAVCAPARCSLLTGLHMGHAHIRNNSTPPDNPLRPEDTTVAEALKAGGYRTGVVGKWGLGNATTTGNPNRKGFDYSYGFLEHVEGTYYPTTLWRNGQQEPVAAGSYQQDLFTDDAFKFIQREKDGPFFLYLAYMVPHSPYEIPSDAPYSNQPWDQLDKNFAAMITYLDRDIGRLINLLKELGIDENTVIFFSSDNGPEAEDMFQSAGPLNGVKRQLYEGGIRIPMIVRWPGTIAPEQVSGQPWAFWDFFPTATAIAGTATPPGLDGISMLPTLLGLEQPPHPPLYWEFTLKNNRGLMQAVRLNEWKGVRINDRNRGKKNNKRAVELYNLADDISETRDVSADHPDIVARIREIMANQHVDLPGQSSAGASSHHHGH